MSLSRNAVFKCEVWHLRRFNVGDKVTVGSQICEIVKIHPSKTQLYLVRKDEGDFWMDEILLSRRPVIKK